MYGNCGFGDVDFRNGLFIVSVVFIRFLKCVGVDDLSFRFGVIVFNVVV